VNEFQGTENEFTIAVSGVVIRNEWANICIVFAMGVVWRLMGFFGIVRLFRLKRPGSLAWHTNQDGKAPKPRGNDELVINVGSPAIKQRG